MVASRGGGQTRTQIVARAWEQITYISKSGNARPALQALTSWHSKYYHRAWAYCEVWYNLTSALFSKAHAFTARGLRIPLHFIAAIASHLTNSGYSIVILILRVAKYTTLFVANESQMKPCAHRWYYWPYLCKYETEKSVMPNHEEDKDREIHVCSIWRCTNKGELLDVTHGHCTEVNEATSISRTKTREKKPTTIGEASFLREGAIKYGIRYGKHWPTMYTAMNSQSAFFSLA